MKKGLFFNCYIINLDTPVHRNYVLIYLLFNDIYFTLMMVVLPFNLFFFSPLFRHLSMFSASPHIKTRSSPVKLHFYPLKYNNGGIINPPQDPLVTWLNDQKTKFRANELYILI